MNHDKRLREPQHQEMRIGAAHAMGQVFMAQVLMGYRRLAPTLSAEVELVTGIRIPYARIC